LDSKQLQLVTEAILSFHHEHGLFLSDELMARLDVEEQQPISVGQNLVLFETVKKISEIKAKDEVKAILASFEDILSNHYSFLASHKITKRLLWREVSPFCFELGDVCPDLKINVKNSLFTYIYRKIEDVMIELDAIPTGGRLPRDISRKINLLQSELEELLEGVYSDAKCIIGGGSFLSLVLKDIEAAFKVSEIELSYISKLGYPRPRSVNPYVLYWLLTNFGYITQRKLFIRHHSLEIINQKEAERIPLTKLRLKTYLPSIELWELGASPEWVKEHLTKELLNQKPFILTQDLLFPLSYPSVVLETETKEPMIPFVEATPYGPVPIGGIGIPELKEDTNIMVQFFDFPLFNRSKPIVLDTSAIDVTRFPYDVKSPFFTAFFQGREVIIPNIALFEVKTRLNKENKEKIVKALSRLELMKNYGFIKNIVQKGSMPEILKILGKKGKKQREDFLDSIIVNTAIENEAIIFTKDRELAEFAFSRGVLAISYNGLEDDVRTVIRGRQGKLSKPELVETTQKYAIEFRGIVYDKSDIETALNDLIKRGEIKEIEGKLYYLGPQRKVK